MSWHHHKVICAYRIADRGSIPAGTIPKPWDEKDELAAFKRLLDGEHCMILAELTDVASKLQQAGYTHLVSADVVGPKTGENSYMITRTDYWFVKLEVVPPKK